MIIMTESLPRFVNEKHPLIVQMFTWIGSLNMHSVRYPAVSSYLNLKHFEVPKQNTTLGSWCFHHLASTHQIRSALCRQTAGACVLWVCPATDP